MSWSDITKIFVQLNETYIECVEYWDIKDHNTRLAPLHSLRHLDASLPASSASNSSLLPEISLLCFESNTHNLALLALLV
jgi:hypothetical protein